MALSNLLILGSAVMACNPQVMCSLEEPARLPIFQPGVLKSVDSQTHLKVGDKAPDFKLPSLSGETVQLYELLEDHIVVLTFVPAAWTPVCSEQWPGYNIAQPYFEESNALLVGITVDNLPTLHAWITGMGGVWFPVLSDFYPHGHVTAKFGILREDGTAERALFVIRQDGTIAYLDVHDINERPPLEDLMEALTSAQPGG